MCFASSRFRFVKRLLLDGDHVDHFSGMHEYSIVNSNVQRRITVCLMNHGRRRASVRRYLRIHSGRELCCSERGGRHAFEDDDADDEKEAEEWWLPHAALLQGPGRQATNSTRSAFSTQPDTCYSAPYMHKTEREPVGESTDPLCSCARSLVSLQEKS